MGSENAGIMSPVAVGRFAPSPTGDLHLGNLRTAVLAWLWSRHAGSEFVVRMEDLDRVTSSPEHEASQLRDLAAIGLDWDGPVVRQSDRFDLYHDAIATLDRAGLLYPCYCTRKEIAAAASAPNQPVLEGYPGTCRHLSVARRRELESSGRPPALRIRADRAPAGFDDLLLGPVDGRADDVVVRRNDGVPAYHLAVVVDDAAQSVGIVVRGDDLATATPSQLHLQRQLGLPQPRYAHVPLVLGPTGERLAKRHGAVTLNDRLRSGDTVDDVARWLLDSCGQQVEDELSAGESMAAAADRFDPGLLDRHPLHVSGSELDRSLRSRG